MLSIDILFLCLINFYFFIQNWLAFFNFSVISSVNIFKFFNWKIKNLLKMKVTFYLYFTAYSLPKLDSSHSNQKLGKNRISWKLCNTFSPVNRLSSLNLNLYALHIFKIIFVKNISSCYLTATYIFMRYIFSKLYSLKI